MDRPAPLREASSPPPVKRPLRRRIAQAAAVAALGSLLLGCTGDGDPSSDEDTTGVEITRPEVSNPEPADRALVAQDCAPGADGSWQFTGRLVNTVSRKADYVVTARVVSADGRDLGGASDKFTVPKGAQQQVDFAGLTSSPDAVSCIADVVRSGAGRR